MRKYIYIFKTTLMENLQYISNILFGFISFVVMIFIFLNLWQYMYQNTNGLISGYSIKQMIWYVVITEMIWFGTRNKTLTNEISDDIKSGKIAYNINKPYNYVLYIIFKYIGEITIKFFVIMILSILVGILFIGNLNTFKIESIPFLIIVFILGIFINAILRIGISLISFWVEENKPFHWIYDKLTLVIGTLFPIEMFPSFLQPIIRYTPIFVVTYGPAKLVVDFSMNMFYLILFIQIIYLIISLIFVIFMYSKGVKKLNVNGG